MHLLHAVLPIVLGLLPAAQTALLPARNLIDQSPALELTVFNKTSSYFVLGGLFSLTSGGVASEKGIHRAEAFKCAVQRINAAQQVLPGKTVYYEIADDKDNAIHSVYQTMGLINSGHMAVVGAGGSALTEADSKVLSSFGIPLISYASSSALLSDASRFPTLLRTVASDSYQTKAMVSIAAKLDWTLMAAIGTDDSYGSSGIATFRDDAREAGIRVPCTAIVSTSNPGANVVDFVGCLKASGVKVVLIFSAETPAAAIITSLYNAEAIPSDMIFIASDSWGTTLTPSLLTAKKINSNVLRGSISTIQWPGDLSTFKTCLSGLNPSNTNYTLFIQYWEKKFGCSTVSTFDGPFCELGRVPSKAKIACKCNGEETLANDTPNNKAALVDDAVYAVLHALSTLINDCQSLPQSLQSACGSPVLSSSNILEAMRYLKFTGLSGEVAFDGVDRTSVQYSYIQYNGTTWNPIGSWTVSGNASAAANSSIITLDPESFIWRAGQLNPPISVIRPDLVLRTAPIALLIKSLASVGIIIALALAAYIIKSHEHAVIKRASPFFCVLMLSGMLLIYVDLYMWDGEQTTALCVGKVWVPLIGFGLVMGPLLVKTFRIYKIFDSARLRGHKLQDSHLFVVSGFVVIGEIILLAIWTGIDPIRPALVQSVTSADMYATLRCVGTNESFQTGMYATFVVYNAMLLAMGVVMSYKTRNVHSSFNESKYIAYAVYNVSLCVAVLLPIYMTIGDAQGSSERGYIVRSLATLFGNSACMFLLFVPKVYQVYRDAKAEDYDSSGGGDTGSRSTHISNQPPAPVGRRQSSGLMFQSTSPTPKGRKGSVDGVVHGKDGKGGSGGGGNVKVLKTVKTAIVERNESGGSMGVSSDV